MYEPIRTKSIHSTMAGGTDFPHRTREEELDIQLAGHLAALLAVTDELRATAPSQDLDDAAERLAEQVTRLREGRPPAIVLWIDLVRIGSYMGDGLLCADRKPS